MKNINNRIIRNSTVITDKLYYLLPLELLLSFLWSFSLAGIWFVNQVSTIISWDVWSQILDNFQIAQSMLLQAMTIVLTVYLLAHILLCIVWIKEDKSLNFIRTLKLLRRVRKQMLSETKTIDSDVLKKYKSIIYSIRCILTGDYIYVIIPHAQSLMVDEILKDKAEFLHKNLISKYRNLYQFSNQNDYSYDIEGERISND